MTPKNRRPTHPGTILKEMYLEPRNVSIASLSRATGISRKHLSRLVHGHVKVSPEVAMKLAAAFDTTPELWLNAQRNVELYDAQQDLSEWAPSEVFTSEDVQPA